MDVRAFPRYNNLDSAGGYTLFKPSNFTPDWMRHIMGPEQLNINFDNILRKVFPGLPADPNYVKEHGIRDTIQNMNLGMTNAPIVDVGNFERGRPIITGSRTIGMEDPNHLDKNEMLEMMLKNSSDKSEELKAQVKKLINEQKAPKISMLSEEFKKTIVKNKNNTKTAFINPKLLNTTMNYGLGGLGTYQLGHAGANTLQGNIGGAVHQLGEAANTLRYTPFITSSLANSPKALSGLGAFAAPFAAANTLGNIKDFGTDWNKGNVGGLTYDTAMGGLNAGMAYSGAKQGLGTYKAIANRFPGILNSARTGLNTGLNAARGLGASGLNAARGLGAAGGANSIMLGRGLAGAGAYAGLQKVTPEFDNTNGVGSMFGNLARDMSIGAASGGIAAGAPGAALGAISAPITTVNRLNSDMARVNNYTNDSNNSLNNTIALANKTRLSQNADAQAHGYKDRTSQIFANHGMQYNGSTQRATPLAPQQAAPLQNPTPQPANTAAGSSVKPLAQPAPVNPATKPVAPVVSATSAPVEVPPATQPQTLNNQPQATQKFIENEQKPINLNPVQNTLEKDPTAMGTPGQMGVAPEEAQPKQPVVHNQEKPVIQAPSATPEENRARLQEMADYRHANNIPAPGRITHIDSQTGQVGTRFTPDNRYGTEDNLRQLASQQHQSAVDADQLTRHSMDMPNDPRYKNQSAESYNQLHPKDKPINADSVLTGPGGKVVGTMSSRAATPEEMAAYHKKPSMIDGIPSSQYWAQHGGAPKTYAQNGGYPEKRGQLRRRNTGIGEWVNPKDFEYLSKSAAFNVITKEEYVNLPLHPRVESIHEFFFPQG
jgi:hypothetical protein